MCKYKCPDCGKDAPVSGGVYNKSYSAEENGMRYFWFPVYACVGCEMEFTITGCRIIDGKNVWQDSDVRREDWEGEKDWEE